MKKVKLFFAVFALLSLMSIFTVQTQKPAEANDHWPCWFSQQYCCDTGGIVGCGVCSPCGNGNDE